MSEIIDHCLKLRLRGVPGSGILRAAIGLLTAAAAIAALVIIAVPSAPAVSAAAEVHWLVKTNDLAILQAQAEADRVTLPAFSWEGCGGLSDPDRCIRRQVPIYTSYGGVQAAAHAHRAGVVIYDIEVWSYTPAQERADPLKWICKAAQLERSDKRLQVMITPYARTESAMIAQDVEAARCGAYAVDIQSQFANGHPRTSFQPFVAAAVKAIRKVSRHVIILAGLATNNPVPQTASNLAADYRYALKDGVQGFWLNANVWSPDRCSVAQGGPGCPQVAIRFLKEIYMTLGVP